MKIFDVNLPQLYEFQERNQQPFTFTNGIIESELNFMKISILVLARQFQFCTQEKHVHTKNAIMCKSGIY